MQEEQKIEPQDEAPAESQQEETPTFAIGNVSVVVTE